MMNDETNQAILRAVRLNKWTLIWIALVVTVRLLIQLFELVKG